MLFKPRKSRQKFCVNQIGSGLGLFCMHFKVIGIANVFTNDLIGLNLNINKKQYLIYMHIYKSPILKIWFKIQRRRILYHINMLQIENMHN